MSRVIVDAELWADLVRTVGKLAEIEAKPSPGTVDLIMAERHLRKAARALVDAGSEPVRAPPQPMLPPAFHVHCIQPDTSPGECECGAVWHSKEGFWGTP